MAMLMDKAVVEFHLPQMGRQRRSVDVVMVRPEMSVSKCNQKTINNLGLSQCWGGNVGSGQSGGRQSKLVLQIHIQTNSLP